MSSRPSDQGAEVEAEAPSADATGSPDLEPLSCVACRSRKLKCDRVKPACERCIRGPIECVYPGSRRKPTFKRRNVKDLEARLAQVEGLLQDAAARVAAGKAGNQDQVPEEVVGGNLDDMDGLDVDMDAVSSHPEAETVGVFSHSETETVGFRIPQPNPGSFGGPLVLPIDGDPSPPLDSAPGRPDFGALIGLGMSEALPPMEVIEELHNFFFQRHYVYIPIVHPGRYLQAFYSAPHMKPPMSLQYIVWAIAAYSHEKYDCFHDIFYRRARMYSEVEEMKGAGEHFITVAHAQAYVLLATYQARRTLFSRASIDVAKAARLSAMMGLHRLDGALGPMMPGLPPETSWVELEERRRTFWGAFCADSHASVSTGWPTLIDPSEIFTRLPTSEDAFLNAREEEAPMLQEALDGASYGTFAGSILICHIYVQLLKHIHRPKADDRPEDSENGAFWQRHRHIDNKLSSVFMFLPDRFRVPNVRDHSSLHVSLNLHASVICLHHAAVTKAEEHGLPESLRDASRHRLRTAAEEIAGLIKVTSHIASLGRSPLAAQALYLACSVYVAAARADPGGISDTDRSNLWIIVRAMEASAKGHAVTTAFLRQVDRDIRLSGLSNVLNVPDLAKYRPADGEAFGAHIPLVARNCATQPLENEPSLQANLTAGLFASCASGSDPTPLAPSSPRQVPAITNAAGTRGERRRTFAAAAEGYPAAPPPLFSCKYGAAAGDAMLPGLEPTIRLRPDASSGSSPSDGQDTPATSTESVGGPPGASGPQVACWGSGVHAASAADVSGREQRPVQLRDPAGGTVTPGHPRCGWGGGPLGQLTVDMALSQYPRQQQHATQKEAEVSGMDWVPPANLYGGRPPSPLANVVDISQINFDWEAEYASEYAWHDTA